MNLNTYTDEALDQLWVEVATERERRTRMAQIPDQVRILAQQFHEGGGDMRLLNTAITPAQEV